MHRYLSGILMALLAGVSAAQVVPVSPPEPQVQPVTAPATEPSAPTTEPATAPRPPATPAEAALAASIVRDARLGYLPENVREHLRQAVVLARMAIQLDPDNAEAYLVLAESVRMASLHRLPMEQDQAVADAQEGYLRAVNYADYASFQQYLGYVLATQTEAFEQRESLLTKMAADERFSGPQRAVAIVQLAQLYLTRGTREDFANATTLCRTVLGLDTDDALDPYQPQAATMLMGLERPPPQEGEQATPPDLARQVMLQLRVLRGDPLSVEQAMAVATVCRWLGLREEAMRMMDLALAAADTTGLVIGIGPQLDHLTTLLDAGRYAEAVEQFAGAVETADGDALLRLADPLIEAYVQLGRQEDADALVQRMDQVYQTRSVGSSDPRRLAERAWFEWRFLDQPATARITAEEARRLLGADPRRNPWGPQAAATVQRIWAITHLGPPSSADEQRQAQEYLANLSGGDAGAAAALVEYLVEANRLEEAQQVLTGLPVRARSFPLGVLTRTGSGWRRLAAIAQERGLTLPPPSPQADLVAQHVAEFEDAYVQLARDPGAFVRLRLAPLSESYRPGEPVTVRLVLENTGSVPLPLGVPGLLSRQVMLEVRATVAGSRPVRQYVPAVFAAPRYLQPAQSISVDVNLGQGYLRELLMYNPLSPVELQVTMIVQPAEQRGDYASAVPGLQKVVAEAVQIRVQDEVDKPLHFRPVLTLTRQPLIARDDSQAYYDALVELVRQFRGEDRVLAMQAAEATVSLLASAQAWERGQVRLSRGVSANLRVPQLLAMVRYCLQEAPMEVRCRTLGAMRFVRLDDTLVGMVAPALQAESEFVRARAVEVLGRSNRRGNAPALQYAAENDPSELVRAMAEASLDRAAGDGTARNDD